MHARTSFRPMVLLLLSSVLASCGPTAPTPPQEEPALDSQEAPLLGTVVCPLGTTTISFDPPLRNEPQDVVVSGSGSITNCTALLTAPVTSGATSFPPSLRQDFSCGSLVDISGGSVTVTWNTGETSQLSLTQVVVQAGTTARTTLQIGTVVSGKYAGYGAVRTLVFVDADLENACASEEGLAQYTTTQTLVLNEVL